MNDSFLKRLRELAVERTNKHYFPLEEWNLLEWAGAAGGECGEMANVAKKIRRGDPNQSELLEQLGEEAADVVMYVDLLCARAGIDLEEAIRIKFNTRSKEKGFEKEL